MSDHIEYLILIAGIAAACWSQVQRTLAWLRGWVVVSKYCDHPMGPLVIAYLTATSKRTTGSGTATFTSLRTHVRPLGRVHRVAIETLAGARRTFWRWSPIWFHPLFGSTGATGTTGSANVGPDHTMCFSFLRGTVDWDGILIAATEWESSIDDDVGACTRFRVVHHLGCIGQAISVSNGAVPQATMEIGLMAPTPDTPNRILRWTHDDIRPERPDETLKTLSLRAELVAVVDRMKFWLDSRPWYADRGIPWRLGALFHGAPGTGKTSLARGIAEDLDLPVHVFDLASMTNRDLRDAWSDMITNAPCMALIEDIDAVFDGRANTSDAPGALSFDCLLNCWDGVERVDGVVVIVTTNEIDKIDPAILSRPGRIDVVAKFQPLDLAGRVKIAERILCDAEEAVALAAAHADDPASQFQERCIRLALERRFSA